MSNQSRVTHPIYRLLPTEIEGFDALAELALDMRWSWNHATDQVWRQLDPELWAITHNPWVVLQTVSRDQIKRVLANSVFRKSVDGLVQTRRHEVEAPAWFQQTVRRSYPNLKQFACFDTAFHRSMPQVAQMFPLTRNLWRAGVRRFGFHGRSYEFIMHELARVAGARTANRRVIIAHLGSGASMAAIAGRRKSLDTSMGFTPTGGLR
jgi:hypothetical protein